MKKVFLMIVISVAALTTLTGCRSVPEIHELPQAKAFSGRMTAEMKLCREMVVAFVRNDAETFNRQFTTSLKHFDKNTFERTRKEVINTLGEPVSFQYLTTLEFPAFKPHFWKIRFRRTDRNGKEIFSESLLRIVTGISPEMQIVVLAFNFV